MATNGNQSTRERLEEILSSRIMLLDGSMGALIYSHELDEEQFRGKPFARHSHNLKNCTEVLVVSQPELIDGIHRAYLEAGADIIETVTFNGSPVSLSEFGLEDRVLQYLNKAAAELARDSGWPLHAGGSGQAAVRRRKHRTDQQAALDGRFYGRRPAAARFRTPDRDGRQLPRAKDRTGSWPAGAKDILLAETAFDTLVMKACLFALEAYFEKTGTRLPVMISGTIFADGRTLSAQPIESFYYSVSHIDALSVGMNCAVGVDLMRGPVGAACVDLLAAGVSAAIRTRGCPTGLADSWAIASRLPRFWASSRGMGG